jgi:hypothetical protein
MPAWIASKPLNGPPTICTLALGAKAGRLASGSRGLRRTMPSGSAQAFAGAAGGYPPVDPPVTAWRGRIVTAETALVSPSKEAIEMTGGLIELAQKYVALTAELEATRAAIAMEVASDRSLQVLAPDPHPQPRKANGAGKGHARPTRGRRRPSKAEVDAQSRATDERMIGLLRQKSMRLSEITQALQAKSTTTQARLKRLAAKSLIERGEDGWRTIAS